MSTKPKPWPHNMAWARNNAAIAVQQAIREIQPLTTHKDIAVVARAGLGLAKMQEALRSLEHAGAPTTPQ